MAAIVDAEALLAGIDWEDGFGIDESMPRDEEHEEEEEQREEERGNGDEVGARTATDENCCPVCARPFDGGLDEAVGRGGPNARAQR